MACEHAGNLIKLQGWITLWCPICDPDGCQVAHEREQVVPVLVPSGPKKTGLQLLLEKNKKEQEAKKLPF